MAFSYIDLFAGCGGLSLGMHQAGLKGLFAIEKNKDAFSTLEFNLIKNTNHFKWPQWLPKTNIDISELLIKYRENLIKLQGNVDLVVGGPPCQGFSMAGKRDQNDIRNKLFHSYISFIELVKPKIIFFENVHGFTVGFMSKGEKGIPFSQIAIKSLEDLDYHVCGRLINVSEYGVPQKRKRYIIIGVKDEDPARFFDLLAENKDAFMKQNNLQSPVTVECAIGDLCRKYGVVDCPDAKNFKSGKYGKIQSSFQEFMRKGCVEKSIPDSHRFANQRPETIELLNRIMKISNNAKRITPKQKIVEGLKKRGITPLKANCICNTITSIPDDFIHYEEPRIMTARELARIQSFPDWYQFKGKYTTGGQLRKVDVPRYTQIANAVPPLFAEQVGLILKEMLK